MHEQAKNPDLSGSVRAFLQGADWLPQGVAGIGFLAAGEYNENYLVESGGQRFVLRVNHGSQLGLGDGQIEYEFGVLDALRHSGVTPVPHFVEPDPAGLPGGVLLMDYLPGRPLDYERDWREAARIFARIHAQPVDERLIPQSDPVRDIATESLGLLNRFFDHPLKHEQALLLAYHDHILALAESVEADFRTDPMCIVNTEVNSHNFIMADDGRGWLVDWEKAVVSSRFQDLGHFVVPTTTRWKADYEYSSDQKEAFVAEYLALSGLDMDRAEAMHLLDVMERTILLRALSWCYMAYYEYTKSDRALAHGDTFKKIKNYLDGIECFLK